MCGWYNVCDGFAVASWISICLEWIFVGTTQWVNISNILRNQGWYWQSRNICRFCNQHEWLMTWSIWLKCNSLVSLEVVNKISKWYIGMSFWVLSNCEEGNDAVFWNWTWRKVTPEELSWDVHFSDVFGSLWLSELLPVFSVETHTGIVIPSIRVGLVGFENPETLVGGILSMVSELSIFGFEITELVCVWDWKLAPIVC